MDPMTIIFEGMPIKVETAEQLIEIAKAKRALSNGHSPAADLKAETSTLSLADFMALLPAKVLKGFEALVKNKGTMTAEALWSVFDVQDNSQLGARFISPVRRVAKDRFESEQVLKKVSVVNAKGEVFLKYRIPQENLEAVRQSLENLASRRED